VIEVHDERALPGTLGENARWRTDFVRSLCDPTVLIRCDNGDVYQRRDGANWKHPAYKAIRDTATEIITVEIGTAYGDHAEYPSRSSGKEAA
jgi:hypothetical protein